MNFVVDDPTCRVSRPVKGFPAHVAGAVDNIARQPVSAAVRCRVVWGSICGTVRLRESTRLPLRRDSTKDCSKSCKFNRFRLVVLNM